MIRLLFLVLLAAPVVAAPPPHTGVPRVRTAPELSDLALFGMAAAGVVLARRAMRSRRRRD